MATWTQGIDAGGPALREYDQTGNQIDEVSASDLFGWHAYVPTGTGIYYATRSPGGFSLTYIRNSDSVSLFLALAAGLRSFSRDGTCASGCGTSGVVAPPGPDGGSTTPRQGPAPGGAPAPGDAGAPDSGDDGSTSSDSEELAAFPGAVMTPLPEPPSVALLLGGLAGLLVLGRVRSRRSDRA